MGRSIGKMTAVWLVCLLAAPAAAFAEDPKPRAMEPGGITAAGAREIARLTEDTTGTRATTGQEQQPSTRNWVGRHPVLFGALVGAAGGVAASALMENELICSGGDEDCLIYGGTRYGVGALMGAGVGALVGLVVGASRK